MSTRHTYIAMPIPIDTRRKPASAKVHVTSGAGVDIVWSDGHASHYDFVYLRDLCPCALCNDERNKKEAVTSAMGAPGAAPAFSSAVLPMFKPKPRAQSAATVGSYAIQITFSDGHSTGIYSFDYLRTICPCADCAREFRSPLQ
jgi:DUF971 family protein